MRLQDLLRPEDLVLDFEAIDKWDALDKLMERLVANRRIPEEVASAAREAVIGRERSMSTGMERGLAIPHAAVEGVEEVLGVLGVLPADRGLNFDSIDAGPSHLVVLLLIPRSQKLIHIRTLADIARVLGRDSVREALLAASSPEEAWAALAEPGA